MNSANLPKRANPPCSFLALGLHSALEFRGFRGFRMQKFRGLAGQGLDMTVRPMNDEHFEPPSRIGKQLAWANVMLGCLVRLQKRAKVFTLGI